MVGRRITGARLLFAWIACIALLLGKVDLGASSIEDESCHFGELDAPVRAILCAVETGAWRVPLDSQAVKNVGCLLGKNQCLAPMHVPTEAEVPPSPPPPDARNPTYQALALAAEKVVPKTWWRDGFADPKLLLSADNHALPRKQFDSRTWTGKRLKNLYQCATRQQFMRKSFSFSTPADTSLSAAACQQPAVKSFHALWDKYWPDMDGDIRHSQWLPRGSNGGELFMAASEVLELFLNQHGGVWTGCFAIADDGYCRGALAAACQVLAAQTAADIAGRNKSFTESHFVRGYILASLGRAMLHGDSSSTGAAAVSPWRLRLLNLVALQAAFLRLYTDSFGKIYTAQLDKFIPLAFPPGLAVQPKTPQWRSLAQRLEPVTSSLRNWMFSECSNLIDFGPYRPLVAFPEVRAQLRSRSPAQRRVLVDVGANGFLASPKMLLDSYAAFLPFTHVVMVEPEPHFSATVPAVYSQRYNVTFLPIYAEVHTGSDTDLLRLLPRLVSPEDFVVLKFDVDPNRHAHGPTMEWGFLFATLSTPAVAALVDEVYIELHFHFPALYWKHYHSNWEALDAFRDLRRQGIAVHSWP